MKPVLVILACLLATSAQAFDARFSYLLEGRAYDYDETAWASAASSVIEQPDSAHTAVLELNLASENIALTAAAVDEDDDADLAVREFYYRGDLAEGEWLIGRRITPFGVGYAFRPLDLIQREDLVSHNLQTATGVNQLAWEHFAELGTLGLYLVHPENDENDPAEEQPAFIARYAEAGDTGDWQVLIRGSETNKLQLGAGGVWLPSEALALHGSMRFSRRITRQEHSLSGQTGMPLATAYPWRMVDADDTVTALVGFNWTGSQHSNVIIEYWHDPAARSDALWRELFDLMAVQHDMLGTPAPQEAVVGNLAWSAQAWQSPNRLRDNVMLRYQWQGDVVSFESTLLYAPADDGRMLQAELTRDFGSFKARLGARGFDGPTGSVYGQMARNGELFLSFYGDF